MVSTLPGLSQAQKLVARFIWQAAAIVFLAWVLAVGVMIPTGTWRDLMEWLIGKPPMIITGWIDARDSGYPDDMIVQGEWRVNLACEGARIYRSWILQSGEEVEAAADEASKPMLLAPSRVIVRRSGGGNFFLRFTKAKVPPTAQFLTWRVVSADGQCDGGKAMNVSVGSIEVPPGGLNSWKNLSSIGRSAGGSAASSLLSMR